MSFTLKAIAGKELSLFETTLLVSTSGNRTDLLSSSCDIQQTAEIFPEVRLSINVMTGINT